MRIWVTPLVFLAILLPFTLSFQSTSHRERFTPTNKLAGIGVERTDISDDLLRLRTDLMIQSQTFAIMREAQAVAGAERVRSPRLRALFDAAERQSGFPASTLAAISYLESFGLPAAESPAGPKGIMQISEATARSMGLKVVRATRYKIGTQTKTVKGKKRTAKVRIPYTVTIRDDRLIPERAIPAAAMYLTRLEQKFNGRDWAIFAYHCGEGCVSYLRSIAEMANGFRDHPLTVARMFFNCSPVYNRNLYQAVQAQMQRDYSPTYWFRVMRAEELLAMSRADADAFRKLADDYRSDIITAPRAPNRLSVWLRSSDLAFRSCDDIRADQGKRLAKVFDHPDYFGYRLRTSGLGAIGAEDPKNQDLYLQASPAAIGTLAYITYETRRLYEEMKTATEPFQPLEVTSLVHPMDTVSAQNSPELLGHCTGQVFDIQIGRLPAGERECLQAVLDDLGWYGYLGFTEEAPGSDHVHIGCSPSSRDFFVKIFQEGVAGTAVAVNGAAK
jgi:Transglycosylase SLT domain